MDTQQFVASAGRSCLKGIQASSGVPRTWRMSMGTGEREGGLGSRADGRAALLRRRPRVEHAFARLDHGQ